MLSAIRQGVRPVLKAVSESAPKLQKRGIAHDGFKGIKFKQARLDRLGGSRPDLRGHALTKHRGEFLANYVNTPREDGFAPHYKYLGVASGHAAVNVVAAGGGHVGIYSGGWQANAMKNRLKDCLPDLLHVSIEEPAMLAEEHNNFVIKADKIQHLRETDERASFEGMSAEQREAAEVKLAGEHLNLFDHSLLADLEQGWRNPEKVRMATKLSVQHGINIIHIEDQGRNKRCGHLGGKELAPISDYCQILEAANFAAQEELGPEQAEKQWVTFVARTDAYSADRIEYSKLLEDPKNLDHPFIDWDRGVTPDGMYLYLKKGINPETGNTWGLDLSIVRGTEVVKRGLASHVWMETPDADLHVAKAFLQGVNDKLAPLGLEAKGLYNHSPSFDWDTKFYMAAQPLAERLATFMQDQVISRVESGSMTLDSASVAIREFLIKEGDSVLGDGLFTGENIQELLGNGLDLSRGEEKWLENLNSIRQFQTQIPHGLQQHRVQRLMQQVEGKQFRPLHHMTNVIVAQRLLNFEPMLAGFGYDQHLVTLPGWHIEGLYHNLLAEGMNKNGIHDYVKFSQRPGRKRFEATDMYPWYRHQTATGTGLEVAFNQEMGSHDTAALSGSTETADSEAREDMKKDRIVHD